MEAVLNYVAAAILASPVLVLLAIPVIFALAAISIALFDLAGIVAGMRDRARSAGRDFMIGFRKGMADRAARHPS